MSDWAHVNYVWRRFVCVVRGHVFKVKCFQVISIAVCDRCNWYGGPTGAQLKEPHGGR